MPIRWRLTLYIALVIGAILLLLGLALFFLLRDALLSDVENTAQSRALSAARDIRSGEALSGDDIEQLTLDGVFVIIRDGKGNVLSQSGGEHSPQGRPLLARLSSRTMPRTTYMPYL